MVARRSRSTAASGAALAASAVLTATVVMATLLAPVPRALAEELPTWDDVNAAKRDVAASEAQSARLDALIGELEVSTGALGDAAVNAAGEAERARAASDDAAVRADTLRASAEAAANTATEHAQRFGYSAALLARSGGSDTALRLLFAADGDAGDLLAGLGRAARLADLYSIESQRAEVARADAGALEQQAAVAATQRERLAAEAQAKADTARSAHEAAERELAAQQASLDTLYAQLASLRGRSVELERQVRGAEQAAAEAAAREQAARDAAGSAGGGSSVGGGGTTAPPPAGVVVDPAAAQAYARTAVGRYGWGDGEFQCLVLLWNKESNWRADAYNRSSGAYGIPQSLPGSKMASAGADWRTNAATQIEWGLSYIRGRYGAPCGAWAHSVAVGWY